MIRRNLLICFLSVAFVAQYSWSDESHSPHPTGHALDENTLSTLQLDSGKRWKTDRPLRKGMEHINQFLAAKVQAIHNSELTESAYSALSQKVTTELNQIFKSCKLEPKADAMLHLVLAEVMSGAAQMRSEKNISVRRHGAVRIVQALGKYAEYFDHPGWKPIRH